jgi:multidrug efflux system membrane fusion protein
MPDNAPQRRRFAGTTRWLIGALIIAAAAAVVIYEWPGGSGSQTAQRGRGRFQAASGPVPVLAAAAKKADVPVYLETVGTTRALNTVTVQSQVDGKLISINFKEGQDVKKGDVLARIDPTTYQATLDQAVAKKAQDEAQLANAKLDLERYERLAATNSINRQQADTQKALVAQLEAQVKSDQAAIDNARAILEYTTVVAPIDGRTGIRMVDVGNVVRAASATGLVVLTQLQPITVMFNLPQQNLPQVNSAFAKGPLKVEAMRSDTEALIDTGTLQVVDNQVDQTTGTVKLKAEFPNAGMQLWPGQFVNVRLTVDVLQQVTVIPTGAVQRGPNGTFVYVVGDDSKVKQRPMTVRMQDEEQAVVAQGVEAGERVVTTGFAQLTDNKEVRVSNPDAAPPAAAPAATSRREGRQRRQQQQRSDAAPGATTGAATGTPLGVTPARAAQ